MTFTVRAQIVKGRIDPAPMVDIVFLLLIFLVLSSPFVLQPGIGAINLPAVHTQRSASFRGLVITVKNDNLLFFNNQVISMDNLGAALKAAARGTRDAELIIKADQQVSHGTVVKIMDIAFDAGISAVNLATRPDVATVPQPK
jgi:biopolymer transport protein ExbD